jgi:hypothetical protein
VTPSGLREELDRIAGAAPTAHVPPDTWSRGRRARRRARLATGAAVLACLALVGGLVLWRPTAYRPPPVADPQAELRMPSHLYAVPDHVLADPDAVSTDLAVGPAAAAYGAEHGVTVVVGAADGAYHLLDLGGPVGGTLSPDGTRLATGSTDHRSVVVVDLVTGARDEVAVLPRRSAFELADVSWSPNGEYLAWTAVPGAAGVPLTAQVGSVRVDGLDPVRTGELPQAYGGGPVAVSDRGVLAATASTQLWIDGPDGVQTAHVPGDQGSPVLLRWDGTDLVDLRTTGAEDGAVVLVHGGDGSTTDLAAPHPLDLSQPGAGSWIDGRHLLIHSTRDELAVATLGDPVSYEVAAEVDRDQYGQFLGVSLATDLLADGRGTVDRPAPDWPWSWPQRLTLAAVGAGALLLAGWLWRRWGYRLARKASWARTDSSAASQSDSSTSA